VYPSAQPSPQGTPSNAGDAYSQRHGRTLPQPPSRGGRYRMPLLTF
jgi:hypothetical protein